uniref:Piezo-type mechanosensitive ion channel component n=1 Tax=Steinernema glaseri TaxID=37863 RepID=A0A1I8ARR4_9BILA
MLPFGTSTRTAWRQMITAWAMTYHSWLTFVLLIVSCAVWMHPDSQRFCLRIIPSIAVYAEFLLFIQYVCGLKLAQVELPDEKPMILRQLGFEKPRTSPPVFPLLLKSLFTSAFWRTLKQRMVESEEESAEQNWLFSLPLVRSAHHEGRRHSTVKSGSLINEDSRMGRFLAALKSNVSRYWIVVNLALLLVISVQNPVVMYRIFYMLFFLLFLACFQLSFPLWRKLQCAFWMIMLAYCMCVLTLIYTYQFHGLPYFYAEYLGMSDA